MIPNYDNLDQVTQADIETLVDYREDGHLDFKVRPYTKDQSIEWLKDVCAFANSGGGAILIGISDNDGKADQIKGLEADTKVDLVTRALSQKVNSQIKPSVAVRHRTIRFDDEREVLIYAIRRSEVGPHGFYDDRDNFVYWKRLETGSNAKMTHEDIKAAHSAASDSIERYGEYHRDSIRDRIERTAGHPIGVFLSFLPYPERGDIIQMENYDEFDLSRLLSRIQRHGRDFRMTFDHFERTSPSGDLTLLRRNGDIRLFLDYPPVDKMSPLVLLPTHAILEQWRLALGGHHSVADELGISGPWVACLSMYGFVKHRLTRRAPDMIGQSMMHFPPIMMDDSVESRAAVLARWADRLWQAGGAMRCDLIRDGAAVRAPGDLLKTSFMNM